MTEWRVAWKRVDGETRHIGIFPSRKSARIEILAIKERSPHYGRLEFIRIESREVADWKPIEDDNEKH